MTTQDRPDPQRILDSLETQEEKKRLGKLRLFFGMSAGVGKTYAMLKAAQEIRSDGNDVVIGIVETHGRKETEALLAGLPMITRRIYEYKGTELREMDLDGILARRPQCVIVDELAHTNAPGSRHPKRYQDVLELLEAGIDVYTTLNVQHLESQIDVVQRITGIQVRETVPDSIVGRADQITLIDITPSELLERLKEGKVYLGDQAVKAVENFFKEESLTALRELALRITAERVETELEEIRQGSLITARWNTSEKLLVAVSHSPNSETLIRATRRHASAMRADWIALNVETGNPLAPSDQARLAHNLKLAQELGGEVVATADPDVVDAIERIARQRDITQIIIGKPDRRVWQDLIRGGTILDRLVRRSHDIDIHVIRPQRDIANELRAPMPERMAPMAREIGLVIGIIAVLTVVSLFLKSLIGYRAVGFVYLLTIVLLATRSTFWPMITAATLSALTWNFLFIPPPYTFHISAPEDIMMFLAYFVVACITGYLTLRTSRQDRLLRQREMRSGVLYDFVRSLVEINTIDELSEEVDKRSQRLFQARSLVVVAASGGAGLEKPKASSRLSIDESEWAVAVWAFQHGKSAGWSTDTLANSRSMCIPLTVGEDRLGVLLFRPIETNILTRDQVDLLMAICHQTAIVLEKVRLLQASKQVEMLQESERLHQTLLNSISHELRTPLTTIVGSTSALKEKSRVEDIATRASLLSELSSASDRLNHVITNLLSMSRINSGVLRLDREWFVLGDLISETVDETSSQFSGRTIKVESMPESILINGDYYFLKQAFANLLRNSCQYSQAETEIDIVIRGGVTSAEVGIRDRGRGISETDLHRIFDKFYRPADSPTGGIGLGLSIAKSVVDLHGGSIAVLNRDGGGSIFSVRLPLMTPPAELVEAPR